jgi:hypothetical protein
MQAEGEYVMIFHPVMIILTLSSLLNVCHGGPASGTCLLPIPYQKSLRQKANDVPYKYIFPRY